MKKLLIGLFLVSSMSTFASAELSCVDTASFKRIDDQINLNQSCKNLKKNLDAVLYKQRAAAKLRALVKNNNLILMGDYTIDGHSDSIYLNEKISRTYSNGPVTGFQAGPMNSESGIEIEYDSDNHPLAPFGGYAIIGEMGAAEIVCYDVEHILSKVGCQ